MPGRADARGLVSAGGCRTRRSAKRSRCWSSRSWRRDARPSLSQVSASWSAWPGRRREPAPAAASTSRPQGSTPARAESSVTGCASVVDTGSPTLLIDHDMGLVLSICDYISCSTSARSSPRARPRRSSVTRVSSRPTSAAPGSGRARRVARRTTSPGALAERRARPARPTRGDARARRDA